MQHTVLLLTANRLLSVLLAHWVLLKLRPSTVLSSSSTPESLQGHSTPHAGTPDVWRVPATKRLKFSFPHPVSGARRTAQTWGSYTQGSPASHPSAPPKGPGGLPKKGIPFTLRATPLTGTRAGNARPTGIKRIHAEQALFCVHNPPGSAS